MVLDEFLSKKGTLITGIVQRKDERNNVIVNIGKPMPLCRQKNKSG